MSVSYGGDKITFDDGTSIASGLSHFRNRIINGAMEIDQRNAGSSLSIAAANPTYSLDRWGIQASQSSKLTMQQNLGGVTPPAGFTNYLGLTVASTATVAAGDYFTVQHRIEGYNFADLGFGTANAKTITISFWIYSSVTGSFGLGITNGAYNRSYATTYTINNANTWEYKTVTITGDTTGTWVGATNGIGLYLQFGLGVGSTNSGTGNSWQASGILVPTGSQSIMGTLNSTFYITGVQLEVGSFATTFERRPFGTELQLCQRYYLLLVSGANIYFSNAYYYTSSIVLGHITLPVTMRAAPTSAIVSGTNFYSMYRNGFGDDMNSLGISYANPQNVTLINNSEVSGTAGDAGGLWTNNASSFVAFQAEL